MAGPKKRQAQAKPANPPKRGKADPKASDKDVYEAEDSDPDEMKHKDKYDVSRRLHAIDTRAALPPCSAL